MLLHLKRNFAYHSLPYIVSDANEKGKTEFVLFGTRQRKLAATINQTAEPIEIQFDGKTIPTVQSYKYLGMWMDENLTFNEHIDYFCKKVDQRIALLRRIRKQVTAHAAETVYTSMIRPVLDYGDIVYGNASKTKLIMINRLQKRCKRVVTMNITTPLTLISTAGQNWKLEENTTRLNRSNAAWWACVRILSTLLQTYES